MVTIRLYKEEYSPGELVQGEATVNFESPLKARSILVTFIGQASVHWTEESGTGDDKTTTTYSNSDIYFNISAPLWGTGHSDYHPQGLHTYYFEYQLPLNTPSSFEGSVSWVTYTINCTIDIPWSFDKKSSQKFIVKNNHLDLSTMPNIRDGTFCNNYKTICCLCYASGPISNSIATDRGGYAIGEHICINAEVDNKSNRDITHSEIVLRQTIDSHATNKTRTDRKELVRLCRGKLPPGESEIFRREVMPVPDTVSSGFPFCKIIDISYELVLIAHPSGPSSILETPVQLVIGTEPP